jgi:phosphoglucosamine mutase
MYSFCILQNAMEKLFGTDGIRGVANTDPITPEIAVKLGLVAGTVLENQTAASGPVLIGRDSRRSGPMLEAALSAGITAAGTDVRLTGLLPTPALAWLTKRLRAKAGVVISASHNPARDNGIKFFSPDGFKLADDLETTIETHLRDEHWTCERPTGGEIGTITPLPHAADRYIEHLIQAIFDNELPDFRGVKVVVDCANGAQSDIAPVVFEHLGIDATILAASPDGVNINHDCGALYTEALQQAVVEHQAAMGVAFDGDADRVILVDEHGQRVDGDRILAMLALDLHRRQQLQHATLVATVMSNLGLELAMKDAGIQLVRTKVGDRYVVEKMRDIGANLGGEQSGHIIMVEHGTTGDGLLTALALVKLLHATGRPFSELAACMQHFPQLLVNIPVQARTPFDEMPSVQQAIEAAERELGDRGRVLVRYSGTELLARVMVEAEDDETVQRIAETIAGEIRRATGQ